MGSLPDDADARNQYPMAEGLLYYFPNALAEVSAVSRIGNEQHNPGQPMHWARGKSTDHANKIIRHLIDAGKRDSKGVRHSAYLAWRALALLQEEVERDENVPLPKNAKQGVQYGEIIPHNIAMAALRDKAMADDDAPGFDPISSATAQSFIPVESLGRDANPVSQRDEE